MRTATPIATIIQNAGPVFMELSIQVSGRAPL